MRPLRLTTESLHIERKTLHALLKRREIIRSPVLVLFMLDIACFVILVILLAYLVIQRYTTNSYKDLEGDEAK
jgi:hypothetical protein